MRPRNWTLGLVLGMVLAGGNLAAEPLPPPVYTRMQSFAVPFRIDPAGPPPAKVQLHVSSDHGQTWRLAGSLPPDQQRFTFRAPADGEYWFMIRSLDAQDRMFPDEPPRAEMRVIVDTQAPKLSLEAELGPAGEVVVRYQAEDPALRPETLQIDYQTSGALQEWRRVALDPGQQQVRDGLLRGQAVIVPQQRSGTLVLRARIYDAAGTPAAAHAMVALSSPLAQDRPAVPAVQYPPHGVAGRWPPNRVSPQPLDPQQPADDAAGTAADPPGEAAVAARPDRSATAPLRQPYQPSIAAQRPGAVSDTAPNDLVGDRYADRGAAAPGAAAHRPPSDGTAARVGITLPPGVQPHVLNTRQLEFPYQLGAMPLGQVGRVELWGTVDGGRQWSLFTVDEDRLSPVPVSVPDDGLYGFRLVLRDLAGNGQAPQSGQAPESWVFVDQTPPVVRLTAVEPAGSPQAPQWTIAWNADDLRLAESAVQLEVGPSADGPWTPIAADLPATGRHTWAPGQAAAGRLFVRCVARDAAGNRGTAVAELRP